MKYKVCDGCPCLNSDMENGTDCNLGYKPVRYRRLTTGKWWRRMKYEYAPNPEGPGTIYVKSTPSEIEEFSYDWATVIPAYACKLEVVMYNDAKTDEEIHFEPRIINNVLEEE